MKKVKKEVNQGVKVGNIMKLINLADLNISITRYLYETKINTEESQKYSLTRLVANNSFGEAVSILHSLLVGGDKRELSIELTLKEVDASRVEELRKIVEGFKSNNFHEIRHQSVAHKNELLDDPAGASSLLLKSGYIQNLSEITERLKVGAQDWFNFQQEDWLPMILDEIDCLPKEQGG